MREEQAGTWSRREQAIALIDKIGLFGGPTVWDAIWAPFLSRRTYVRIRTKTGQEIVGAFESGSWVGLSPEPRQLFLSTLYREEPPGSHKWKSVDRTKGVFIDASEIESIEFAR
jgi:hypothetical protein